MIVSSSKPDSYIPLNPAETRNSTTVFHPDTSSMIGEEENTRVTKANSTNRDKNSSANRSSTYRSHEFIPVEKRKQSSLVTIFSIWNTMVGTSLLAMPWGFERAGLPTGFAIAVIMGGICLYTAYCNIDVQKQHGSHGGEVFQLCNQLLGVWTERIAKFFSLIVLLGAVIVYWILMSNFFNFTVDFIHALVFPDTTNVHLSKISGFFDDTVLCPKSYKNVSSLNPVTENPVFNVSSTSVLLASSNNGAFYKYWNLQTVPIYLAVLVTPLLCFKSATFFTKFNSLGTISVMYLMLFVFIKSANWGFVNVTFSDETSIHYSEFFSVDFGAMCGMLSLSYFIHNIIISIMSNNKNQNNNPRDLTIAYLLVILTYTFIGAVMYTSFPIAKKCIEDNVLNNFNVNDPLTVIARVCLFFQLITVYPLIAFMLRSQVLTDLTGMTDPSYKFVILFNIILVGICVLFAIFIPHIGTVIRFTGALSGFVHVFTIPCLLKIASLKKKGELTIVSVIVNLLIPILGAVNILLQFFVKDK